MSKPMVTLKALTDKLEQNPREAFTAIAATVLYFSSRSWDENETAVADEIIDRLFPPEPEWKPLRLEWEQGWDQDGAKLRFRCVEIDERDDRSSGFISPDPYANGAFKIDMYNRGRTGFDTDTLRIVIGCFDRTWSDWKTFPSESDAIAFYDKARMAVYELNKKRDCKSDLPYNTLRKIEQPWTPLIIAFRKNRDGRRSTLTTSGVSYPGLADARGRGIHTEKHMYQRIGKCGNCGGNVMWHVEPWLNVITPPPDQCDQCGATTRSSDPVIPMNPVTHPGVNVDDINNVPLGGRKGAQ